MPTSPTADRPGTLDAPLPVLVGPSADGAFHHGARSSFNAAFFDRLDRYINRAARRHKRVALADLPAGRIVEIGAGVGANFEYLPTGASLTAIEPNLAMHARLVDRAHGRGIEIDVVPASATTLPFPDGSVDAVVATLVLCTVDDPDRVLAEVRRVLRPGGTFRFVEHVAAPRWSPRSLFQRSIRRPWRWVFEGCDTHRHTGETIERAGFRRVELHRGRFRSVFVPVNTAIYGIAHA